ncbi:MAG: hypothetical protein KIS62_12340 [Ramlibacter sp.]|nr:hypothetical protein [Ramlibacter sp.]MCW5650527.1 hypothetical protein [Ramlibacter sp.]
MSEAARRQQLNCLAHVLSSAAEQLREQAHLAHQRGRQLAASHALGSPATAAACSGQTRVLVCCRRRLGS